MLAFDAHSDCNWIHNQADSLRLPLGFEAFVTEANYTASMVALVLSTSFRLPSREICKNASHP